MVCPSVNGFCTACVFTYVQSLAFSVVALWSPLEILSSLVIVSHQPVETLSIFKKKKYVCKSAVFSFQIMYNGQPITKMACGAEFSMIMDCKGNLYSFGCPEYGQLGMQVHF